MQWARWLGGVELPLQQTAVLDGDGRLLLRFEDGELAEPTGQLNFDFSAQPTRATVAVPEVHSAGEYFEQGVQHEQQGRFEEAAEAYRRALSWGGPNAIVCFNLANTLY